ncbi:MAG: ketopantoate reductase family protein [Tepidiformaceae bacterium]
MRVTPSVDSVILPANRAPVMRRTSPRAILGYPILEAATLRHVIYGAGAVGGTIGACLFESGHDVVLIARGRHLETIQSDGLTFETPTGIRRLRIPAVPGPEDIDWRGDEAVYLSMKTQDTQTAIERLRAAAGTAVPVICAQNGVENERIALRRFANVYAMLVVLPATHLEAGAVRADSSPVTGLLDTGRYPSGVDATAEAITTALSNSTFVARPDPTVMRWKYAKLLTNLGNALQAVCGPDAPAADIRRILIAEAIACYRAAGIEWIPRDEYESRRSPLITLPESATNRREGGSTWQSLVRGTGSVESDYLNGEISLLGRVHGIPTPANSLLQQLAARAASSGLPPGNVTVDEVRRTLGLPVS